MTETQKTEKHDIPAHIRLLVAGYILTPHQSPAQREVDEKIEKALEDACYPYSLDLQDVCDELNSKHREGEVPVYAAAPELLATLETLLADIECLIGDSEGVGGLHRNGDFAPWSELTEGGAYEHLSNLSAAADLIKRVKGETK